MKTSTTLSVLSVSMLLGLCSCGGGGSSGGGSAVPGLAPSTATSGSVVSVDGQTLNRSGLTVMVPATGSASVTDASGSFDLGKLPAAQTEIVFIPPTKTTGVSAMVDLRGGGSAVLLASMDGDSLERLSVERTCGSVGDRNSVLFTLNSLIGGRSGIVTIERRTDSSSNLKVKGRGFVTGERIDVMITHPVTAQTGLLGTRTVGIDGEFEVEIEGLRQLPVAVSDFTELEGFVVDVAEVSSGKMALQGTIPAAGRLAVCGNDDAGRQDMGRSRLVGSTGVTGEARVELESRSDENRQKLEVKIQRSNVSGTVEFWMSSPFDASGLHFIGDLVPEDFNELEYEVETRRGQALPFGVSNVSELSGLSVELRSADDGLLFFSGTTPFLAPF